jgi:1,4-dihydroxy-2-naphthoate octaprenyltransferase
MTANADVSRREAWLMAARPQTLPAGAAPVVVGVGLAVHDDLFAPLPALAALVGALLLQIGTNFANDYYDAIKGTDSADREGFTRVTAGGLIDATRVKQAMVAAYGLAFLVGIYLVWVGGLPIVVVGLTAILAGVLYTGGPYPYGYRGLGDLFVFVYFGVVAVSGTYYVQAASAVAGASPLPLAIPAGTLPATVVLASLAPAGLSTAILVVNNIRDREEDAAADKRTLAVIFGYRAARAEWVAMVTLAYLVPVTFALSPAFGLVAFLPWLTLPLALAVGRTVLHRTTGEALNPALERTGQLMAAHSVLFAIALGVGPVM